MKKVKLGEILDVKRGTTLSGNYYSEKGEKIRLTLGNFNYPGGGFKENSSKKNIYFTGNVITKFILKKGDIITPLTEQVAGLLGESARIPKNNIYVQSGDIGLVVPKESELDKLFAYYLISSPSIKKQLGAAAQQTKIRHTSPDKIKSCFVWLPDIQQQRNIATLLDFINSKIELNNRINADLETMAKTLYNYWFVQFDFPDKNGKPYKSTGGKMVKNKELKRDIPDGWEAKKLNDIFEFEKGIEPGSSEYLDSPKNESCIKFFRVGDIEGESSIYIDSTNKKYVLVKERDVIVAFDGSVGKLGFGLDGAFSGGLRKIYDKSKKFDNSLIYFIFRDERIISTIHKYATGSILLHASSSIDHLKIPMKENVYIKFQEIVKPIFEKMVNNKHENQKLAELRDWLLPMLMNGQVVVGDRNLAS